VPVFSGKGTDPMNDVTVEEIFEEFAREIGESSWPQKRPDRTNRVVNGLTRIGRLLSVEPKFYYKGCPGAGEFMLDFCCMDGETHEMRLAAESEWREKAEEVEDDFQKLVYTRAKFKMMMFGMGEVQVFSRIKDFVSRYPHAAGDTYLFVQVLHTGRVTGWKLTTSDETWPPPKIGASRV
jgi:hypothetical protein